MKSRLQAVSTLLLIALVLSFVPAAALPTPAYAAECFQAQFIADVTVPDGATYDPGATFKKTWRLRNNGGCPWNNVSLIFDSGTQMGGAASVPITSSVNPGQNVDVSVDLTAPNAAGHYIGYWKLKTSDLGGIIFGIGRNANNPFWVEINVKGTPTTSVVYDFAAEAANAQWESSAGGLPSPGPDGDARGYWLTGLDWKYEDGSSPKPAILVAPAQNITNGYIKGTFPAFKVQTGDVFKTQVGCELPATSCYVQFSLAYQIGTASPITIWRFNEKWDQRIRPSDKVYPDIKLDALAGQDVKFILSMSSNGSPVGDRALWGNPVIARKGIIPPTVTGTPPTATPSNTPGPVTVPPSACDKAQFIADVSIPDGTVLQPGATFTKTWRLKNVGSCQWSTSYQLVFFSGAQMGAAASATFPKNVAIGETVDVSINMTAPSAAGSYRGFWMFKNAGGTLFGIGAQANKPWWVDIKVSGSPVTPGGPTITPTFTVTPGGPSVTPGANTGYDFAARACEGTWTSGAGTLPCPGTDGDAKGFVLKVSNPKLESGTPVSRPGLLTFPQNVQDGYIKGSFPAFKVQSGDRFRSDISCEGGATTCYVGFRVDYQTGNDPVRALLARTLFEKYEGRFNTIDVDLSSLAGKDVKFILTVLAAGTATGDRALWVGPHIYRPTSGSALPDLTITQLRLEYQNPSCLITDDPFGLRVGVTNSGQAAAASFNVKAGDTQQTVNGLAVGETKAVFFAGFSVQTGSSVTVIVDSNGAVGESNEQNNSRTEMVPVPTQPLPCTPTLTATPTSTAAPTTTSTSTSTSTATSTSTPIQ